MKSGSCSSKGRDRATSSRATVDWIVLTVGIFSFFESTIRVASCPPRALMPVRRAARWIPGGGSCAGMMRSQLDAIHDRGELMAILWVPEGEQPPALRLRTVDDGRRAIEVVPDRTRSAAPDSLAGMIRFIDVDEVKTRSTRPDPRRGAADAVRESSWMPALLGRRGLLRPQHRRDAQRGRGTLFMRSLVSPTVTPATGIRDKWDDESSARVSCSIVTDLVGQYLWANLDLLALPAADPPHRPHPGMECLT